MSEEQLVNRKVPRLVGYFLDFTLLLLGSITVCLVQYQNIPGAFPLPFILGFYIVIMLAYLGLITVRNNEVKYQRSSYDAFNQRMALAGKWALFAILIVYLIIVIYPVYASGLHCINRYYCTTITPIPIHSWMDISLTTAAFYLLIWLVWMVCIALFLRLLIRPNTRILQPKLFWIIFLFALNASFYITRSMPRYLIIRSSRVINRSQLPM